MKSSEIVIIGGGIIGLLTALELAEQNLEVMIIDRDEIGREASWAGGGILASIDPAPNQEHAGLAELRRYSNNIYSKLAPKLLAETGVDIEYLQSGLLYLDNSAPELELNKLNNLNPKFKNGRWFPEICQIRNPRLLRALKILVLKNPSIKIFTKQEILNFNFAKNQIISAQSKEHNFFGNIFILAAGAWSGNLLKNLKLINYKTPPIFPVFGQILLLKYHEKLTDQIIMFDQKYLVPRLDGKYLIGSTLEDTGFEKIITEKIKKNFMEFAELVLPDLKNSEIIGHWGGLRPGRVNTLPLIGKLSKYDNLYINSGHFRCGLGLAPGSARLLSDIILKRSTNFDPEIFEPNL